MKYLQIILLSVFIASCGKHDHSEESYILDIKIQEHNIAFNQNGDVVALDLEGNKLNKKHIDLIVNRFPKLESINLSDCDLSTDDIESLGSLQYLESIFLYENTINPESLDKIFDERIYIDY